MAIDFEAGSNQYLALAGTLSALQNVTGGTMMGWCRPETFNTNTEGLVIHWSVNGATATTRMGFSTRDNAGTFKWRTTMRRLDADGSSILDSTMTPTAGTLYHVAVVAEYNNQIQRIYINGVQDNSQAVASWTGATSNTASSGAAIGTRADLSTTIDYDGVVEDLRVYNRALSANEIATIYAARGADNIWNGLRHRWRLNERESGFSATGAASIKDMGPGAVTGTPTNSPVYAVGMAGVRRPRRAA